MVIVELATQPASLAGDAALAADLITYDVGPLLLLRSPQITNKTRLVLAQPPWITSRFEFLIKSEARASATAQAACSVAKHKLSVKGAGFGALLFFENLVEEV